MSVKYKVLICIVVTVMLHFVLSACSRPAESKKSPLQNAADPHGDTAANTDHDHSRSEHDAHEEDHGHKGEKGHVEHDHSDHAEKELIKLGAEEIRALGIAIKEARFGEIHSELHLQGEIRLNADRTARIVSRLAGIVSEVHKTLGDRVARGDVLAVIESRDLAESRAAFHAAVKRLDLARIVYDREQRLWRKKISAEQEFLDAEKALAEARIELQMAREKLIAVGISRKHLDALAHDPDEAMARYELVAPFDGIIVEKNITLGEVLDDETVAFVVSDLSRVWADFSVYQKDLFRVKKGQKVLISTSPGQPEIEGTIGYVGPIVEDSTRRALARVVLPNSDGSVRPGIFVTAKVLTESASHRLIIAKSALQNMEGNDCVFIETGEGFTARPVITGERDDTYAEVLSGMTAGDKYVAKGAFELKAKIITSGMDSHAGHGH